MGWSFGASRKRLFWVLGPLGPRELRARGHEGIEGTILGEALKDILKGFLGHISWPVES